LTSAEIFSVRTLATRLGELLEKPARFAGRESESALVGNTAKLRALLGDPPTPLDAMLKWTADWVRRGGRSLGKPTHFEVRDGRY
jgi:nucleoside-diphosphate-sugar epimerase